ncbi:hypothetical protein GB928_023730 [Shinella curvata]|uniref:Uncharacterized protein n=1 Tax=Shinella curvata TaxID=1817964 RepID=A0ABT8XKD7_9HYPH|nr:hypothetical protein [Shinella curvata]MCJ8056876.1 hypothetical protein [Shinella curvata]MDO6124211.1 hypothetical protein [Shinella curvata]
MMEPIRGMNMPSQRLRRLARNDISADLLVRAIRDIDTKLEQHRLTDEPAPFSIYRARRMLKEAHARCRARVETLTHQAFQRGQAARPDAMPKPHRSRRGLVERYEALPGFPTSRDPTQELRGCAAPAPKTNSPHRSCECDLHAYEGTDMTYDWTGETTRKRNRVKLAAAILLSVAIVLGVPTALTPFL